MNGVVHWGSEHQLPPQPIAAEWSQPPHKSDSRSEAMKINCSLTMKGHIMQSDTKYNIKQ